MATFFYWAGFLLYCAVVLVIGWRGYRRGAAVEAFWSAGRTLGPWSVGLSISASFMSISWSCMYMVQLFYWHGVAALWLVPIPWLLTMAGFYLLAPFFRRLPAFSQPEMLTRRFGPEMRKYLALPIAFVFLVWGGAEIFAAAKVLSPLLQAPFVLVLALIAAVVAGYSALGGFSAVVITDRVQFALVAFFIISMAVLTLKGLVAGGNLPTWQEIPPPPKNGGASALALFAVGPALIFMTLLAYLPGWLVETDVWLRIQAARDLASARRGVLIAALNSLLFLVLFPAVIGFGTLVLYPPAGGIPARLEDGAAIFSVLMQDYAPTLWNVFLSVGLAAAAMSTIDTCTNVVALSLSYDLVEPWLERRGGTAQTGLVARGMSVLAVALAFVYALFTESLWDIFYLSSGVLTTTLFLPLISIFLPRVHSRQARAAAVAGFVGTFFFYWLENYGGMARVEPQWLAATGLGYILWGLLCSVLGLVMFMRPDSK